LTAEIVHVVPGEPVLVDTSSLQEIPLHCDAEETVIKILDNEESNKSSLNEDGSPNIEPKEKGDDPNFVSIVLRNDFNIDTEKVDEEIKQILPAEGGPESISRQFLGKTLCAWHFLQCIDENEGQNVICFSEH
jgi:hypothetical protein